jgi:hypothetical protein
MNGSGVGAFILILKYNKQIGPKQPFSPKPELASPNIHNWPRQRFMHLFLREKNGSNLVQNEVLLA